MKIRVATYNVHNTDGSRSLEGIAAEISATGADLVALQELDRGVGRTEKKDVLLLMNDITKYNRAVFCKSIDYDGGEYGIGALINYPIINIEKFPLTSSEEGRILAKFTLRIGEKTVIFYNTHLSLVHDTRQIQIKEIASYIKNDEYFILCGDFNIDSFSELNGLLRGKAANRENNSINTFKSGGTIDNIIISENMSFSNIYLSNTIYSDHNMLVCDIDI